MESLTLTLFMSIVHILRPIRCSLTAGITEWCWIELLL